MYMSLSRSVIFRLPASSSSPTSPVCSQPSASIAAAVAVLAGRFADATVDATARTVTFEVGSGVVALAEIVRVLDQLGLTPEDLVLRRPTLDEVFLTLTAAGEVAR